MTTQFTDLNLHPQLVETVSELGYTEPTPVQASVIPLMLEGHDILAQSKTGTGKTAAFILPVLNHLDTTQKKPKCLVIAPTRELAMQVANATYQYGQVLGVRVLAVYGGQPYGRQKSRLNKGVDVVGKRLRVGEDAWAACDDQWMRVVPVGASRRDVGCSERLEHIWIVEFERYRASDEIEIIQPCTVLERASRQGLFAETPFTDTVASRVQD